MTKEKEQQYGPICSVCSRKDKIDEFDSASWLQIVTELPYNQHGDNIVWVCPDHLSIRDVRKYKAGLKKA